MNKAIVIFYTGECATEETCRSIGRSILPILSCSPKDIQYVCLDQEDMTNCIIKAIRPNIQNKYNADTLAAIYIAEKCNLPSNTSELERIVKILNIMRTDEKMLKAVKLLGSEGNHVIDPEIANRYRMTDAFFRAIEKAYKLI